MRFFPKDKMAIVVIVATLIFYSIMLWYPILDQFALSMHKGLTLKRTWVGFANFRRLMDDAYFSGAILVTFRYALMFVPITVVLGLLLAAAMNRFTNVGMRTVFTSMFFFPNMVPIAAAATFWKFLLAPTGMGAINSFLGLFGVGPLKFLEAPETALASLALVAVWGGIGYTMVLFLAGMQSIPRVFYESASIDGANARQQLLRNTVPLLMPTLAFVVIMLTLGSLQVFAPVYIMTGGHVSHDPKGGPAGSTTTIVWLVYETAFQNFKQGYAAAMAVVWFFVLLVLGLVQFYVMSRQRFEY